ncbi:MAG: sulfotransferase [Tunicatimonas sp.]
MVYIVLGMHKSGTTMLSEILHKSGINMGDFDESINYYEGQKYEREDISHAIWDVLDCRDLHSLDTFPPFNEAVVERELPTLVSLVDKYNGEYASWGFKEPRSLFVYEKIKPSLGNHKVICVYRNLKDVVLHYLQFAGTDFKSAFKVIRAWKLYNEEMLRVIRHNEENTELMLCNYGSFVAEPNSVDVLSTFVGQKLVDVRKPRTRKRKKTLHRVHQLLTKAILFFNFYDWKSVDRDIKQMKRKVATRA